MCLGRGDVSMYPARNSRNAWLDVCRATAVLLVVLSHGRHFLIPAFPQAQLLKFGGFVGVELFFVLSGFLVGGILIESAKNGKHALVWVPNFWLRRWIRTVPSYFLFVLINYLIIDSIRVVEPPKLLAYLTFTQNLAWEHPPFFGEAWSLAVEEIFYFFTPLIIVLFSQFYENKNRAILCAVITIFSFSLCLRIAAVLAFSPAFDEGVRKVSIFRLDALMTGVIFSWLYANSSVRREGLRRFSVAFIPLFFVSVYFASKPDAWLDSYAVVKVFLFTTTSLGCIGLVTVGLGFQLKRWFCRCAELVARWSYGKRSTNDRLVIVVNR